MQAEYLQITDLHSILREMDGNLHQLGRWVLKADLDMKNLQDECNNWKSLAKGKEVAAAAGNSDLPAPEVLEQLQNEIMARDNEIITKDQRIKDLEADLNTANQMAVDLNARARDASLHTQITEGGSKVRRTAKIDDPPAFYAVPSKDKMPFPLWWLHVESKLTDNADWFLTEMSKVRYVTSRLAGAPAIDILPYMSPDNPHHLDSVDAIKKHLHSAYEETDRKRKAQDEWEKLRMGDCKTYKAEKVDFQLFKNAFVRLGAELRKPKDEWKEAFERRLTATLQKALAAHFLDDDIDFPKIALLAQKVDYTNKRADEESKALRAATQGGGRGGRGGHNGGPAAGGAPSSGGDSGGRGGSNSRSGRGGGRGGGGGNRAVHTPEEFTRLMAEGRCLNCKEKGHRRPDCPKVESSSDRANRINALYQTMYGTPAPSTTEAEKPESNNEKLNSEN